MRTLLIIFSVVLLSTTRLFSQLLAVKGSVYAAKTPVRYAAVTFTNTNDKSKIFSAVTDTFGNFQLKLVTAVAKPTNPIPKTFVLDQNYPNPFSSSTAISYELNKQTDPLVTIYDILGREIKTFVMGVQPIGNHGVIWDGTDNFGKKVSAGVYFYRVDAGNETRVNKMVFGPAFASSRLQFPNTSFSSTGTLSKQGLYQSTYTVQISNTDSTQPRVVSKNFGSLAIYDDTTLNFGVDQQALNPSLEIYFLLDSTITEVQAAQTDINQLVLRKDPWLKDNDVQFYDFSSHCIYLKGDKRQFFENDTGKYFVFSPNLIKRPFVVVASKARCYVGSFHPGFLSTRAPGPFMNELDVWWFPTDIMHISSKVPFDTIDIRSDDRIKDALSSLHLYHGGISVNLNTVSIVANSDTSTVDYSFTIINSDPDTILVLDPDKMGSELFHYFTNGVIFSGNGVLCQSTYKKVKTPEPADSVYVSWFATLPGNTSIERTVRLKGYPHIPIGIYSCSFIFAGPMVEKASRYFSGGRIWMGDLRSSNINFEVK